MHISIQVTDDGDFIFDFEGTAWEFKDALNSLGWHRDRRRLRLRWTAIFPTKHSASSMRAYKMENVSFATNQAVLLAVNPIDDSGAFADVESTQWTSGDPQRLFFGVPTADEIAAVGALPEGVDANDLVFAQFFNRADRTAVEGCKVRADAKPGAGERPIEETFSVTPLAPEAASLGGGIVGTVALRSITPPTTEPPPVETGGGETPPADTGGGGTPPTDTGGGETTPPSEPPPEPAPETTPEGVRARRR